MCLNGRRRICSLRVHRFWSARLPSSGWGVVSVSNAAGPHKWVDRVVSRLAPRRKRGCRRFAHESLERRALLSAMPQGPEFRVNTFTTANQINSAAAMDNGGNFVVVWQSAGQDGAGEGIFGQRYSAAGVPQGGEFRVNQFTTGNQLTPAVAMDDDGDFVIAWNSVNQQGTAGEIWARRFDPSGGPKGD